MNKEEFLNLFELENVYNKYKNKKCFILGLHDNITGTKNAIFFIFEHSNKLKISIDCFDFGETKQELEIHLLINDEKITINEEEPFKNELFTFLTFNTNLDSSLKFIAIFINKILIPKYNLISHISTYWTSI